MPRELKLFHLEAKAVDVAGSTFEGFSAGIGNVDHQDDQLMPGAFRTTIRERVGTGKVKLLDGHDPTSTRNVWGVVAEAEERPWAIAGRRRKKDDPELGLWSLFQVSRADSNAQVALQKLKEGILDALSIGYRPVKVKFIWKDEDYGAAQEAAAEAQGREGESVLEWEWYRGNAIRQLLEVSWWETSLVTWGMNDAALVIPGTVKSLLAQAQAARARGGEWKRDEIERAYKAIAALLEDGEKAPAVLRCAVEATGGAKGVQAATDAAAGAAAQAGFTEDEQEALDELRDRYSERTKDTCSDRFAAVVASAVGAKPLTGLTAGDPPATVDVAPPATAGAVAQEPAAEIPPGRPETRHDASDELTREALEAELVKLALL